MSFEFKFSVELFMFIYSNSNINYSGSVLWWYIFPSIDNTLIMTMSNCDSSKDTVRTERSYEVVDLSPPESSSTIGDCDTAHSSKAY